MTDSNYEPVALTIPARELQRGDYIHMTMENGRSSGGSSLVEWARLDGDTMTAGVFAGQSTPTFEYPGGQPVTVWRY